MGNPLTDNIGTMNFIRQSFIQTNGTWARYDTYLEHILCNTTNLNYTDVDEIVLKGVDKMRCIKNKTELALGGTFSAAEMRTYLFSFEICVNSSSNNFSCASIEEILAYVD
jgi:hypothetical protein